MIFGLARQERPGQAVGFFLIGFLVGIGAGVLAANRREIARRLHLAWQLEEQPAPIMRQRNLGFRDAVVREIEEAGIDTSVMQGTRDARALVERSIICVGAEIDDRDRLARLAL